MIANKTSFSRLSTGRVTVPICPSIDFVFGIVSSEFAAPKALIRAPGRDMASIKFIHDLIYSNILYLVLALLDIEIFS